jgi:hypothetical protein
MSNGTAAEAGVIGFPGVGPTEVQESQLQKHFYQIVVGGHYFYHAPWHFNGLTTRYFGGKMNSYIIIREIMT